MAHKMGPLPGALGGSELVAWRLDKLPYAQTWDSGIGARNDGGRWNSAGTPAVYCSLDPATAIIELAVHKGFKVLDTQPHILTSARFQLPESGGGVAVVRPEDVPNPNWLRPGTPSANQQALGDELLAAHGVALFPSVVSSFSWNLVFHPEVAKGWYEVLAQERFELDTRLQPPVKAAAPAKAK